ncbi:MAG: histone-like nucleoid-structuring protein Lsr2 [Mycobacteriales bacterium]
MARVEKVILVDDLDGGSADETVLFGMDGTSYEIDLSAQNAAKLRDMVSDYVGKARKVGRKVRIRRGGGATVSVDREQNQAIRDWAKKHGLAVSDRGRISTEISDAYNAARG